MIGLGELCSTEEESVVVCCGCGTASVAVVADSHADGYVRGFIPVGGLVQTGIKSDISGLILYESFYVPCHIHVIGSLKQLSSIPALYQQNLLHATGIFVLDVDDCLAVKVGITVLREGKAQHGTVCGTGNPVLFGFHCQYGIRLLPESQCSGVVGCLACRSSHD